jgi:hypothetical protein
MCFLQKLNDPITLKRCCSEQYFKVFSDTEDDACLYQSLPLLELLEVFLSAWPF